MQSEPTRRPGGRTALAAIGAIGSILAASGCCLPILPFIGAAGLAGSSAFFSVARPYLMALSILCIAYGFYQARRAQQCRRHPSIAGLALLWISTVFVAVSIFFPQAMANAAADLFAR